MKGFIEVTGLASGLSVPSLTQTLAVDRIDCILDVSAFNEEDRANVGYHADTKTVIYANSVSTTACEVTEDYATVLRLIEEAQ